MRAAVYLRQSLDRTGEMLAIARQRKPCLELCRQRGWDPVEYVDNDKSATKGKRPRYEDMLADIESEKIQAVVTWDLDRLHRQPIELEHFILLADRKQVALATVTGEIDLSTDMGRLQARVAGAFARREMERKSARQKASHQQRAERGIPWGDRRTFGYTSDHELHPAESARVKAAYRRIISGGSLASIAKEWNAEGVTTTLGNAWNGPAVSQLLRNPKMAGLRAYRGVIVGKGQWPAIVPEDVWRTAQGVLSDPSRNTRPGARTRKYLLTGIAVCGKCGARLSSGKTVRGAVYYRCNACLGVGRSQAKLDAFVIDLVVARLSRPDAGDLVIDRELPSLDELQAESATIQRRKEVLAVQYAEGLVDDATLRAGMARLNEKQDAVDVAMRDAAKAHVFEGILGAEDVEAAFLGEPLDRQRAMVAELMAITVEPTEQGARFRPESIRAEWKS